MQTPLTIDDHTIVTLTYEVRDGGPTGPLLERMDANYPFVFMFGIGKMLPAWERRIYGLKSGMGFTFQLAPQDAYGVPEKAQVIKMPLDLFKNEREQIEPGLLVEGQFVTLTDTEGKAVNAKILKWDDAEVTLDGNHALAGKSLFFSGAVLNVRKATVDELIQKRYIDLGGVRRE
ncbi:FKBP-type peptidyl-prolyl cis-trans isomerase [Neolewinella antarctica]|uniref:Peptidyl-prolyl cis-trans isomerase n=1 Tax=Neolewinella antarctica TaxID=442734 RepID=A0ABX0XDG1_9BACT|nr:FKBP-type peptidyl-prolyl cis-trans isomerase [Neolewinella antarctica]NJC27340.1 FKBP-type peptidyl-prolyl cis-trans isomerase SlyD [Neolewinella antarctica]